MEKLRFFQEMMENEDTNRGAKKEDNKVKEKIEMKKKINKINRINQNLFVKINRY